MSTVKLCLYVAGDSPNSVAATKNLRRSLERIPAGGASLEIVDVLEDPQRALREGVIVTPTMVRKAPLPERRIVGDLRKTQMVAAVLGLDAALLDD